MRGIVCDYDITVADSLDEALDLLASKPGHYRPLAGGTDLMVVFNAGQQPFKNFLSIHACSDLKGIEVRPTRWRSARSLPTPTFGTTPFSTRNSLTLCQAAAESGAGAIQNRGTLGGNIGNGSPAADTPPALAAYHAEIDLISSEKGVLSIPFRDFQIDYKKMDLQPGELIRGLC